MGDEGGPVVNVPVEKPVPPLPPPPTRPPAPVPCRLPARPVAGRVFPLSPWPNDKVVAEPGMGILDARDGLMPSIPPILDVDSAGEDPRGRLYGSKRSSMLAFRLPGRWEAEPPVDSRYCIRDGELDKGDVASCMSIFIVVGNHG